ncbi:hypothetical protein ACN469_02000 [Corallococcus terminator]
MKLKAGLLATALFGVGCGAEKDAGITEQQSQLAVASAVGEAQSADVPLGARFLDGLPQEVRRWEHEGYQCDAEPETAKVEVCGQSFPSELHLSWTDCQARTRGRGGCGWDRPQPPPDSGTPTTQPTAGEGPRGEGPGVVSSGSVDVVTAIAPAEECAENAPLRFEQQSTHDITHTATGGQSAKMTGSIASVSMRVPGARTLSRSVTFDTTRTNLDAQGTVVDSIHLTGTLEETFDPDATEPKRTSHGTLTATLADGSVSTVTQSGIVRVPPSVCAWPIAGTQQRTLADGTTHTLVYGPECGQATLDGEALALPSRPMGPGDGGFGGKRPGGGPPPPRGGPGGGGGR